MITPGLTVILQFYVIFLTAVKLLIQKLLEQLMGKGVSVDEQEDETAVLQRTQCTISALCQWYKTVTKVREDKLCLSTIKRCLYCERIDLAVLLSKKKTLFHCVLNPDMMLFRVDQSVEAGSTVSSSCVSSPSELLSS